MLEKLKLQFQQFKIRFVVMQHSFRILIQACPFPELDQIMNRPLQILFSLQFSKWIFEYSMFMPFQHCPHLGGKKVASTSCYSFQISAKLYYDEVKTSLSVDCSLKCLQERSLPQKTLAQKVYVIVVTCAQS